jgi:transposase-like protein
MQQKDRGQTAHWLGRPLCRRYVTVVFSTSPTMYLADRGGEPAGISWALGSLMNGELEVLGAWRTPPIAPAAHASVFGELHERGAEFIRCGAGALADARPEFKRIYKTGALVASVEQALEAVGALVPPRHRHVALTVLREAAEAGSLEAGRAAWARFQGGALGERYPDVVQGGDAALSSFESLYSLDDQLRGLVRSADRTAAEVRGRLTRAILRHGPYTDSAAALDFVATALARAEQRLDREHAAARAAAETRSATSRRVVPLSAAPGVPALA